MVRTPTKENFLPGGKDTNQGKIPKHYSLPNYPLFKVPSIHLTTFIQAPVERVFDLARSIDLHQASMSETNEKAIAGITKGLINEGESVTWEARHLYKTRQFTSKISLIQKPFQFTDEMTKGDFKNYRHEHHFKTVENGSFMIDLVEFETPYGFIGRLLNKYYLVGYLEKLIIQRNNTIKVIAESEQWKTILN